MTIRTALKSKEGLASAGKAAEKTLPKNSADFGLVVLENDDGSS